MSKLSITSRHENNALIVKPVGRIDTSTSPQFESEVKSSISGIQKLILDFSQIEYISSSGLRVLLNLHKAMLANGGRLTITNASDMVLAVFDVTGFATVLDIKK